VATKRAAYAYQAIVNAAVAKLKELPDGTETCTAAIMEMLYGKCTFTERGYDYGVAAFELLEYHDFDRRVRKQAKKAGLLLDDSPSDGLVLGLLFNCPYIVRHKHKPEENG